MNEINEYNESVFESIKHVDDDENEYWCARELMPVLEYKQWRRFESIINKAMDACKNNDKGMDDHFANVGKIVKTGVATKKIGDYKLSRYACYLIVQNGDSRKKSNRTRSKLFCY